MLEAEAAGLPLVADPVMVAQSGDPLLEERAVETLKRRLVPLAAVLTPNAPEAERLTGRPVADLDGMKAAADDLLALGATAALGLAASTWIAGPEAWPPVWLPLG